MSYGFVRNHDCVMWPVDFLSLQRILFSFIFIKFVLTRDAAMETDEGEKEVPAKKPKTEPVLVRPSLDL